MVYRLFDHVVHESLASNLVIRLKNVVDVLHNVVCIAHWMSSLGIAKSYDASVLRVIKRELLHRREHSLLSAGKEND